MGSFKGSARRRIQNVAAIEDRKSLQSDATNQLLSRQLASIADTLAKASHRRDAEVRLKATPKIPPAHAEQVALPTAPTLISDIEGTESNSGDGAVLERQKGSGINHFSFDGFDFDLAQGDNGDFIHPDIRERLTDACLGGDAGQGSLPGGHASDGKADELLSRSGQDEPELGRCENTDPEQLLRQLDQLNLTNKKCNKEDPKKIMAYSNDNYHSKNVNPLPAAMTNFLSVAERAVHGHELNPKQSLEPFRHRIPTLDEPTVFSNGEDDPTKMLAKPAVRASQDKDVDTPSDCKESLEALHDRLMRTLSPEPATQQTALDNQDIDAFKSDVHPAIVPYVVALMLEVKGFKWEEVCWWSTYLFSSGPKGYKARQLEKEKAVTEAEEELEAIIKQTLEEEERDRARKSIESFPRRLIVSNLAAGAGEDDVEKFFNRYRSVIRKCEVLAVRDPVRRAQTAHVDFATRRDAIRASYMVGNIFGLLPKIKLAVEKV